MNSILSIHPTKDHLLVGLDFLDSFDHIWPIEQHNLIVIPLELMIHQWHKMPNESEYLKHLNDIQYELVATVHQILQHPDFESGCPLVVLKTENLYVVCSVFPSKNLGFQVGDTIFATGQLKLEGIHFFMTNVGYSIPFHAPYLFHIWEVEHIWAVYSKQAEQVDHGILHTPETILIDHQEVFETQRSSNGPSYLLEIKRMPENGFDVMDKINREELSWGRYRCLLLACDPEDPLHVPYNWPEL